MRTLVVALTCGLIASGAFADTWVAPVEIDGVSREKAKNEFVLQLTRREGFRLTQETDFRVVFEHDAEVGASKPLYQSSAPVDRLTFTVAETDRGVQVACSVDRVENGGTPLERRMSVQAGKEAAEAYEILAAIKSALAPLNKHVDSTAVSATVVEFKDTGRVSAPKLAVRVPSAQASPAKKASPSLGFSADLSTAHDGGLVITQVDPRTPAAKAGLQPSDIVTAIDGQPVTTGTQMEAAKIGLSKRKRAQLKVIRDGRTYDAMLKF